MALNSIKRAVVALLVVEFGKRNALTAAFNPCNFTQARINALKAS